MSKSEDHHYHCSTQSGAKFVDKLSEDSSNLHCHLLLFLKSYRFQIMDQFFKYVGLEDILWEGDIFLEMLVKLLIVYGII